MQEGDSIIFQGLDTSASAHDLSEPSSPNEGLSDPSKIAIMVIMGCVLLVVALVCAWILFGRKDRNISEDTSGSAANTVHDVLALSTPPRSVPSSPQCKPGPQSIQMVDALTASCSAPPFMNSSWSSERSYAGATAKRERDGDIEVISLHV